MKASQLIAHLAREIGNHGDREVIINDDGNTYGIEQVKPWDNHPDSPIELNLEMSDRCFEDALFEATFDKSNVITIEGKNAMYLEGNDITVDKVN